MSPVTFYIKGIFCARLDDYDYVYRLLEDKLVAYMYFYLVKWVSVPMSNYNSCSNLYTISGNVYGCIYHSMPWRLYLLCCKVDQVAILHLVV